jgi:hypothetical protein
MISRLASDRGKRILPVVRDGMLLYECIAGDPAETLPQLVATLMLPDFLL